jgi:hypothetical protein
MQHVHPFGILPNKSISRPRIHWIKIEKDDRSCKDKVMGIYWSFHGPVNCYGNQTRHSDREHLLEHDSISEIADPEPTARHVAGLLKVMLP